MHSHSFLNIFLLLHLLSSSSADTTHPRQLECWQGLLPLSRDVTVDPPFTQNCTEDTPFCHSRYDDNFATYGCGKCDWVVPGKQCRPLEGVTSECCCRQSRCRYALSVVAERQLSVNAEARTFKSKEESTSEHHVPPTSLNAAGRCRPDIVSFVVVLSLSFLLSFH